MQRPRQSRVLSRKEDESPTDFFFTASCKTLTANRGDRSSVAQNRPSDIRSSSPKASIVKYALPSKLEQGFENCGLAPNTGEVWPDHWPRPSRLLPAPEPIDAIALLPDHPPVSFTCRGIRRRVMRADGPERVFGEWWKRDAELATVRDYFQVEDEAGERYWIYRAGDGEDAATGSHRWFLHGVFG